MLKLAVLYKDEINKKTLEMHDDEHFKYWYGPWNDYDMFKEDNNYSRLQYVSVSKNGEIIGYFSAGIYRDLNSISSLSAINYTKKNNITFSRDLKTFIDIIFVKNKFRKIVWHVLVGNPAEKMYDKIIKKYNGRIIGTELEGAMTSFSEVVDLKYYELFREDYLSNKYKKKSQIIAEETI